MSNLPNPSSRSMSVVGKHFLEFIVKNQDQRATDTSPEVTQVALEKSSDSFLGKNLWSTVDCALVLSFAFSLTTFHHQSSSDGIEGVSEGLWSWSHNLSEQKFGAEWCVLLLLFSSPNESFSSIVTSEIRSIFTRNRKLCMWRYRWLRRRILDTSLEFRPWRRFFYSSRKGRWIVFLLRIFRYRLRVWFWRNREDKRRSSWSYQRYLLTRGIWRNIVPCWWLGRLPSRRLCWGHPWWRN